MAWSTDTGVVAGGKDYTYRQETITLDNSAGGKTQTSVIDFVPAGADFTIHYAVADVAANVHSNVLGSYAASGTFPEAKADIVTAMDNASYLAIYDVSANGAYPVYKVEIEEDGTTAAGASKDVTVTVSWVAS